MKLSLLIGLILLGCSTAPKKKVTLEQAQGLEESPWIHAADNNIDLNVNLYGRNYTSLKDRRLDGLSPVAFQLLKEAKTELMASFFLTNYGLYTRDDVNGSWQAWKKQLFKKLQKEEGLKASFILDSFNKVQDPTIISQMGQFFAGKVDIFYPAGEQNFSSTHLNFLRQYMESNFRFTYNASDFKDESFIPFRTSAHLMPKSETLSHLNGYRPWNNYLLANEFEVLFSTGHPLLAKNNSLMAGLTLKGPAGHYLRAWMGEVVHKTLNHCLDEKVNCHDYAQWSYVTEKKWKRKYSLADGVQEIQRGVTHFPSAKEIELGEKENPMQIKYLMGDKNKQYIMAFLRSVRPHQKLMIVSNELNDIEVVRMINVLAQQSERKKDNPILIHLAAKTWKKGMSGNREAAAYLLRQNKVKIQIKWLPPAMQAQMNFITVYDDQDKTKSWLWMSSLGPGPELFKKDGMTLGLVVKGADSIVGRWQSMMTAFFESRYWDLAETAIPYHYYNLKRSQFIAKGGQKWHQAPELKRHEWFQNHKAELIEELGLRFPQVFHDQVNYNEKELWYHQLMNTYPEAIEEAAYFIIGRGFFNGWESDDFIKATKNRLERWLEYSSTGLPISFHLY